MDGLMIGMVLLIGATTAGVLWMIVRWVLSDGKATGVLRNLQGREDEPPPRERP